jgi:adenylyltransferase/sulfurtransferase
MKRKAPQRCGRPGLSEAERLRYARQIIVPGVGLDGQARLKEAGVLIVGAGGLGSPTALYLAAAGIGRLGMADPDVVEASNLQRQILHFTSDIGRTKVESARRKLADINPFLEIDILGEPVKAANALSIIEGYDVVVDGSDNFPARYVINDACVLLKKPMVYGSVQNASGQVGVFNGRKGPCYRCLMPRPPAPGSVLSCAEAGVLGVVPGVIGTLQAAEAVKIVLGLGTPLVGRLLFYDALVPSFDLIEVSRDPECPACGRRPSIVAPVDYDASCASASPGPPDVLSVGELKRRLAAGENPFFLDIREPGEMDETSFRGALHIPRSRLMRRLGEIPRDREVIVLCRIGIQSREIIRELRDLGFDNLLCLEGGAFAWKYGIEGGP